ncbi:hypothetical protein [Methylomicrobium lacus]|uniref:hypothetical protein n=1 Tax=Methylomicrobium lacus TaxID=136992 RepID=UPI0035A8B839
MKTLCKAIFIALAVTPAAFAASKGSTTLISKSSLGNAGNKASQAAAVSTGGKAVAFESEATNFVLGDTNLSKDIFIVSGKTIQRASINSNGYEAQDELAWDGDGDRADSWAPAISAKGSAVVFVSRAANLDLETDKGLITTKETDPAYVYNESQDTNGADDIFLRDIAKKRTYRVSGKMNDCTAAPKDCSKLGALKIITETTEDSENPSISGDGRFVAYTTETPANLIAHNVSGTDTANKDVFLHDTKTHRTDLISGQHDGTGNVTSFAAPGDSDFSALSSDGRLVVLTSNTTNLVPGDVNDADTDGDADTGDSDVFAYDTLNRKMIRISGHLGNGVVESEANGESVSNRFSVAGAKGRYFVAFHSKATNLDGLQEAESAPKDYDDDVFVADLQTDKATNQLFIAEIRRVSGKVDLATGLVSEEANGRSRYPAIAATKTAYSVAFESDAYNMLTPLFSWQEDSNDVQDIYVYDGNTKLMSRASLDLEGFEPQENSENPAISSDGRAVAFDTTDPYMVLLDGNQTTRDVFLRRR